MRRRLLCLALLAFPAAAGGATESLYDALGGQAGLDGIVGRMLEGASSDPRSREKFDNINLVRLRGRVAEHICALIDGPCRYRGPSMAGAHRGLDIRDRHFNALVEHLQAAMDAGQVPFRVQNRVLARLAPLRRDIVGQ